MEQKLRPIERLQTTSDFRWTFRRGRCFSSPTLTIHYRQSQREFSRMGLVVSRRRGKSHVRSRIKRLLREVFRERKFELPQIYDVVLIPRGKGARNLDDYRSSFAHFLEYVTRHPKTSGKRRQRADQPVNQRGSGDSRQQQPQEPSQTS